MIREAPAAPLLHSTDNRSSQYAEREPQLDVTNIQGNILAGFNKDYQTLVLLRITDPVAARAWLKRLVPYVATTA